jgi:hypothetical protein
MIFYNSPKQQYFIITISKNYSSVIHIDNKNITTHIVTDLDFKSLKEILHLNNNTPISLILTDEKEEKHKITASSPDQLNTIMLDNLQLKYSRSTFNRAASLGKTKDTPDSYEYLLVTINRNKLIDSWINYLFTLPNEIEGIYSFPITTSSEDYISALSKSNKDEHRLYNPDISSILLKKKLKYYKKIFMITSIALAIIIIIFLSIYK